MRRILLLTFAVLLVAAPAAQAEPRIAPGVTAAGIDVSNLTLSEASNRIAFLATKQMTSPLSTHVAGRAFILRAKDVDFKFDAAKSARRAYNAGLAPHTDDGQRAALRDLQEGQGRRLRGQDPEDDRHGPRVTRGWTST